MTPDQYASVIAQANDNVYALIALILAVWLSLFITIVILTRR